MGCTNARLSDRCDTASATSEATEQPQQFGSQPGARHGGGHLSVIAMPGPAARARSGRKHGPSWIAALGGVLAFLTPPVVGGDVAFVPRNAHCTTRAIFQRQPATRSAATQSGANPLQLRGAVMTAEHPGPPVAMRHCECALPLPRLQGPARQRRWHRSAPRRPCRA